MPHATKDPVRRSPLNRFRRLYKRSDLRMILDSIGLHASRDIDAPRTELLDRIPDIFGVEAACEEYAFSVSDPLGDAPIERLSSPTRLVLFVSIQQHDAIKGKVVIHQVAQLVLRHLGFDPDLSDHRLPHRPHVSLILFSVELNAVEVDLLRGLIHPPNILVPEKPDDLCSSLAQPLNTVVSRANSIVSHYLLRLKTRQLPSNALDEDDT